ncbi:MAG: hypothetical protein H6658_11400 [Ardenticatenaceae bacterium]|nr:hypothetical protein [Ardenticatenaceae bacterium]
MSNTSRNEGIIISGGTIDAGALAVGKGAKAVSSDAKQSSSNSNAELDRIENTQALNILRETLIALFNEGELRDLCFQLGEDYENMPGQNKSDRVRELILLLNRKGQLEKLVGLGRKLRPNGQWFLPTKTNRSEI